MKISDKKEEHLKTRGNRVQILIFSMYISIIVFYAYLKRHILLREEYFNSTIYLISILSLFGSVLCFRMIPPFMEIFLKINHFGVDINKVEDIKNKEDPNRKEVPETLGLVSAVVFLVISIVYQTLLIDDKSEALKFSSTLIGICFMAFLGFVDDMVDLRWRYKLVLPTIASIPIVLAYSSGKDMIIPNIVYKVFSIVGIENFLFLSFIYKLYVTLLSVFCTNSINIYSGINGLEVGQSIVIAFSLVLYNLIEISKGITVGSVNINNHFASLSILLMFISVILPLFYYNKYPSKCFIGDTFCYFSGITLASSAIIGNFSLTLLLFFIPQISNFLISLPQLIGIVPCPRHRLPTYNAKEFRLYSKPDQLNILNQYLRFFGPTREQDLCNILVLFQGLCSGVAFIFVYQVFPIFK